MQIKKLLQFIESVAPPVYQESYDNAGLIVGDSTVQIKGVLICLDSTEAVIDEAIALECNLVIAHHPIVFKGLKRLNGQSYVERVVMKAIKNDVAIYAIHTNLDNVYSNGVNAKIAERLGLENTRILAPKTGLKKLKVSIPPTHSDAVRIALFRAGAGSVNGFEALSQSGLIVQTEGKKQFPKVSLEVVFPFAIQNAVLKAMEDAYPRENIPYEISNIENKNTKLGSGMIGELKKPVAEKDFLKSIKKGMNAEMIRHTKLRRKPVQKVAICGGTGGFLLRNAIAQKADVFITADYKYHEFFDAEGQIVIADIGHYESEQFTIDLLYELITNKFSNFAAHCTKVNTNPVNYL